VVVVAPMAASSANSSGKATDQERVCDGCFNRLVHEVRAMIYPNGPLQ
jgi:hypothetical protein